MVYLFFYNNIKFFKVFKPEFLISKNFEKKYFYLALNLMELDLVTYLIFSYQILKP